MVSAGGRRRRSLAALTSTVLLGAAALAGCSASADGNPVDAVLGNDDTSPSATATPAPPVKFRANLPVKGDVSVDTLVKVTAKNGTLKRVALTAGKQTVPGDLAKDGTTWTAGDRLEPGTTYRLTGVGTNEDGKSRRLVRTFQTIPLTLDQQTYPSIAPVPNQTVGVGMPVIVHFDVPVTDKAAIEKHMSVVSKPAQPGTWHWISDNEVRWRPKTYWKPGTDVTVNADINGVDAGNGIYGQMNRSSTFHVGDALEMDIDLQTHQMKVTQNGRLLRTIPVTGGADGFTTRSGIKVIIEKFEVKRMNSATVGIQPGDPEYYNIPDVRYAMRVTYSGEFLHAAPWSVGSQGAANVSHGCVGMSTDNAAWLYGLTKVGDVVKVTGSDRPMEPTNGYGDWNVPWKQYREGSALH